MGVINEIFNDDLNECLCIKLKILDYILLSEGAHIFVDIYGGVDVNVIAISYCVHTFWYVITS